MLQGHVRELYERTNRRDGAGRAQSVDVFKGRGPAV
jgi:hypothetical protein